MPYKRPLVAVLAAALAAAPLGAVRAQSSQGQLVTTPLAPLDIGTDNAALQVEYRKYGVPIVLIEGTAYFPRCVCEAGWCTRRLGGDAEARRLGGDAEGRKLGGDTQVRTLGGDTQGRTLGGDTQDRTLGSDTQGRTLGGDTQGRTVGGDTQGRTVGGDTQGRTLGGDTQGRVVGGDAEGRRLGGDAEARRIGGDANNYSCTAHKGQYGWFQLFGLRNGLRVEYYDGKTTTRATSTRIRF